MKDCALTWEPWEEERWTIVGLGLAAHGMQKLLGWFGGHGLKGTAGFFESIGFRPGLLVALTAGLAEVGGGLLTATGLLGPIGPGLMIVIMVVGIAGVHLANGFFAEANGYELPLVYAVVGLVLAIAGPGTYALDELLGVSGLPEPTAGWIVTAVAVVAGLAMVAVRRVPSASAATADR
jgi:putative oxidoreductase